MTVPPGTLRNHALRSAPLTGPPTLGLLVATLAWAGSFTWAKAAGDAVNQAAGLASGALLGPVLLLAWRFTAAGIFWLVLIPEARRRWSWASVGRSVGLGGLPGPDKPSRLPLTLSTQWAMLIGSELWLYVVLLIVVSTMAAFGLMFYFQPKLDPTRAALIYLAEPIFAALYAYVAVGRTLSSIGLLGAGLILAANVLMEILERYSRQRRLFPPMRQERILRAEQSRDGSRAPQM